MEENEHPVWAELRDMQAHERREFEARARGEGSSFSRRNPRRNASSRNNRTESPFHFPWGGTGGRGGDNQSNQTRATPESRYNSHAEHGGRAGRMLPGHPAGNAETAAREDDASSSDSGGNIPELLRGLGIGGGGGGGRGLLFSRFHSGGERGGAGDDMGPAEFGLLMGEEGEDGGPGASDPLLADEWGAVENLDVFFTNMYKYYQGRGLLSIVARGVAHLLILAFTVLFSTFLLSFVDWKALLSCRDEDSCHPLSTYVTARAFRKPNVFHVLVWMYMFLFLLYWLWSLLSFWASLRDAIDMHHLYTTKLRITPMDLHSIEWSEVVRRFLALQNTGRYRVAIYTSDVTAHDIASRIMRKENYLIAMLNKGILKLSLPLPFFGSRGSGTLWATTGQQYLTKSLEWSVHFCVLNHMFGEKFTVRRAFLDDVRSLRVRLVLVGLAHVVLLPFLLMFMLVYFFLQNAQEWHSSKSYLGPREWTPLARWTFREFNELPHFFEQRMSGSYVHANAFLMRFPRPVLASVMRVTRFVSGAVVAVLLVVTVIEDTILLYVKFWDRNLLWYIGVFSAMYAFSRSVAPQASETSIAPHGESVEEVMLKVASHTHFMPEEWWGKTHTTEVRGQLLSMFKYKAQLFVEELLSVLFAPVILCLSMPGCAQEIVDFVTEHTVDVEDVGSVCSYSLFDFGRYGDEDYAAPSNATGVDVTAAASTAAAGSEDHRRRRRPDTTEQGKMEKSFLNFRANYPDWQPGAAGQEMIDRLAGFQLQCLRKEAETVAANTAAAVAAAAAAAATTPGGGGGAASQWGHGTGVSQLHVMHRQLSPGAAPRGSAGVCGGGGVDSSSVRSGHQEEGSGSVHQQGEAHGPGARNGGGGGDVCAGADVVDGVDSLGGRGGGGGDERDDHPSPLFPLFSPPRGGGGGGGVFGGVSTAGTSMGGGLGAGGGGYAAGGRLSPSMGLGPSGLGPSTLQLGLLSSVSPSMLLGTGGGPAWMGGATGGGGGGGATGGLFGMSAAAPSFVQASQLAPFLLSQMGPQGSWGGGIPSHFARGPHGAPLPPPPGQSHEQNFYWLERFYAAHRSDINLCSAVSDDIGETSRAGGTAAAAGRSVGMARHNSAGGLGPGGGFSRIGSGSAFATRGIGGGSRYPTGRAGGGLGLAGVGPSPSTSSRGHSRPLSVGWPARRGESGSAGVAGESGGDGRGVGGERVLNDAYAMEMTAQQHQPELEPTDIP